MFGAAVMAAALFCGPAMARPPAVVVSLKPLHSLVTMVMDGVATPALLLPGASSPHSYTLRPSDARMLAAAGLVVWGGPQLESFLEKPIQAVASKAQVLALLAAPGVQLLPVREAGVVEHDGHHHEGTDPHFWLDPTNGARILRVVAEALAEVDPANAGRYWANAETAATALVVLDREVAQELEPVRQRPFLALHDALQYFEVRYHLRSAGTLTVSTERIPGARTIAAVREQIQAAGVACVVGEQQFPPALANTITQASAARLLVIDTLGVGVPEGAEAYPALLRRLARDLKTCLSNGT